MPRNTNRTVSALIERYFGVYPDEAARAMERMPVRDVVQLLEGQEVGGAGRVLQRLTPDLAADALSTMSTEAFVRLSQTLEPVRFASLMARISEEKREGRLAVLAPAAAKEVRDLMSYDPETAGSIMDPIITTFRADTTVKEAMARLRALKGRPVADLFIVDGDGRLVGALPLQELAVAEPSAVIESLKLRSPARVQATSSKEELVEVFARGIGTTVPVVDFDDRPLGVIRNDQLVAATEREVTADLATMTGASKDERALSPASFSVRARHPWLQINLATAFLASAVVALFQDTIAKYTALAVLLPVVAGQSGNTGMQALAVTLRGLALREIRVKNWPKVALKELAAGAMNGVGVAIVTAIGVYLWSRSGGLAVVIGISMVGSMIIASVAGASVPMVLTKLGLDPAQASSVVLTTVTDCGGFLSFLGLAVLLQRFL
ncbi:MAG: magnesium transporter [Gemmatimonadetes bacterium]|nr:magnesium transporter [Gemmatimonadota bacterium]